MKTLNHSRRKELKTMKTEQQRSQLLSFFWKVPAIAAVFFACKMVSSALVTNMGLRFPEMPGQIYVPILDFLSAVVLAACLAFLARGIGGSLSKRWLILFAFTYVSYVVNNQIEGVVFTTNTEVPAMLLFFLFPCVLATGATILLIRSPESEIVLSSVFADRPIRYWWWRVMLAWLVFPVIYYFFGGLIYPLVADVYAQQDSGLQVPSQFVILGAVGIRSLFFLLASLPILVNWRRSRRSLVLSLAAALAAMVGVAGLIESTWMPTQLRIVHSVEIIADSLVHAWVLVILLVPKPKVEEAERIPKLGVETGASN